VVSSDVQLVVERLLPAARRPPRAIGVAGGTGVSPAQLLVTVGIVVVALAIAAVLRRRGSDAPTQPVFEAPTQLDRADFPRPEAPWLVVVFSSATCQTCADMVRKSAVMASREVEVVDVEFSAQREVHRRYRIEAVPTTVIADQDGVVRRSFLGSVSATDLWAAVAECREPGSVAGGGCG
jgi:thioredoxin-related protein